MYKLNDKVVYPGHGVAIIEEEIEKKVAGASIKFFKLNFLFKDMMILLPINNLENSGVRVPASKKEIDIVINELYKTPPKKMEYLDFTPSGWNRRNKEFSFGEKSLLNTAEELLVQEIQLVTSKDRETIIQNLHTPFRQFFFQETGPAQQVSSSTA